MNKEKDFLQIDLLMITKKIWSYKIWIALVSIVFGVASYFYSSLLITPKYSSTTKIYVVNKNNTEKAVTTQDIQLGNFLVKDYKEIILSQAVLKSVINNEDLVITPAQLAKKIYVGSPKDTRILSITVTDTDPKIASDLANSIRQVSSEQIKKVTQIENVSTLEEAVPSKSPSSPNIIKNTILAAILGLGLSIGLLLIIELLDDKVRRPEDVEETLGIILLGIVPDTGKK